LMPDGLVGPARLSTLRDRESERVRREEIQIESDISFKMNV
jgi:hypothetical protein